MKARQTPPPSFALAVPGPSITAPRDGRPLNQTRDRLFVAVLHERSRATSWIQGVVEGDGIRHYHACPPPLAPQATKGGPLYLSTKTLRRRLVQNSGLFDFRRLLQQPTPKGATISVAGYDLTANEVWQPSEFAELLISCISKPILLGQPDRIIAELPTTPLFSWCDLTAESPSVAVNCGDWICPHCGIISSTHGLWSSPPQTWAMRCGRAYDFTLCVTCLLVFDRRLSARN